MRLFQYSTLRALCAIAIGILLSAYPTETAKWVIILIGTLFLCSGAASIACFFVDKGREYDAGINLTDTAGLTKHTPRTPWLVAGAGSFILGLVLTLMPDMFRDLLVYVLAVVLIIGALSQLVMLDHARRMGRLPWSLWLCPSLVLVAAIMAVCRPAWAVALPVYLVGISMIVYGVVEIVNMFKIRQLRRALKKSNEEFADYTEVTD